MQILKIIVVDDHASVREGLRAFLDSQSDLEVVGAVSNGNDVLTILNSGFEAEVLLTDYYMPVIDGLELIRQALSIRPSLKVIMLSTHPMKSLKEKALAAGAKACLDKKGDLRELLAAIRA